MFAAPFPVSRPREGLSYALKCEQGGNKHPQILRLRPFDQDQQYAIRFEPDAAIFDSIKVNIDYREIK
jgi:hypothetical protein